ncbi:MAG: hypothetical protein IT317_21605 [Anaerolineales bacterium]|nr:hypothetical protein [Anaerolineales bacterium]
MINLDDLAALRAADSTRLLDALDALPAHLEAAWAAAQLWPLPEAVRPTAVLLAAAGTGALAADLAVELAQAACPAPLSVWRAADPPAWVGAGTLVLALRPTGEEDEPRLVAQAALARGALVLALDRPLAVPDAAAVGPLTVWLLGLLARLGLAALGEADVRAAAEAVRAQQARLRAESPVNANPAKRMAGQLLDRLPLLFAAAPLTAVARCWAAQINRLARAPALALATPDVAYVALAGSEQPEALVRRCMVLALRSTHSAPRADWLTAECRRAYMTAGFNTDEVAGAGPSPLAHALTAMHYGDYAAFYLAACYGVDPGGL